MALDDILNEFFGEDDAEKEQNEQAKSEAKEVPFEAVEAQEEPQAEIPQEPEAPAEPAQPSEPEIPVQPQQSAQSGEYSYIPPRQQPPYQPQGAPYQAPYTQPPVYTPPTFTQQPQQPQQADAAAPAAPKKKSKAVTVIIIIGIICLIVAIAGIGLSKNVSSSDSGNHAANSIFDFDNDADGEDEDNSDAQVSVKSSDEAAKTDEDGNLTVAGVVEASKESCVGITVYTEQNAYSYFYNYGQQGSSDGKTASGEGSGVIMSEANGKTYIMTCAHVIADGSSFTVTLDDDTEYEATMVGYDSQTDIGVLSINATGLTIAEFGDSKDIEVGEDCVAIGCPGGLQFKNSVTKGIVSALDVPVSSSIGYSNECIQVDAAINPGNSGGALFNMQGQVIGINSSKIASTDYEGMGFAVPSNTAVETANSLIKNGYVSGRAKLGIQYNTLENFTSAQSILSALNEKGYQNASGTMVIQVVEDESDLSGKVQQYDMIVAVNGQTMTSVDVLTSILAKSKPGDTVTLTIARIEGNQMNTFDVDCKLIESKN